MVPLSFSEQETIQSGLRIFTPHLDLSKPLPSEFPNLTDREALVTIMAYHCHWPQIRIAKALNISQQRVGQILVKVRKKLVALYRQ